MKSPKQPDPPQVVPPIKESSEATQEASRTQLDKNRRKKGMASTLMSGNQGGNSTTG